MLEGIYKQNACPLPCGKPLSRLHHRQTSGCARWNIWHLCRVQDQGYDKMAQLWGVRGLFKTSIRSLAGYGEWRHTTSPMMYWIEA